MSEETQNRYRVVAMIPTEVYIDGDSIEDATASVDWLFQQYPAVDAPISSAGEARGSMEPKVLTVEQV